MYYYTCSEDGHTIRLRENYPRLGEIGPFSRRLRLQTNKDPALDCYELVVAVYSKAVNPLLAAIPLAIFHGFATAGIYIGVYSAEEKEEKRHKRNN